MSHSLENTLIPGEVFFDAEVPETELDLSEDTAAHAAAFDRFMTKNATSLLKGIKKTAEPTLQKTSVERFSWIFKSKSPK